MFKFLIILLIFNFFNSAFSSTNENIISQLKTIKNLSFNFIQTIDDKKEKGNCIILYPKKMFCEYNGPKKKIIVSNGKSVAIKTAIKGGYYLYPLSKTPLQFLLDKDYLISQIKTLKPKTVNNKYLNFKLLQKESEINIFFNKNNLQLVGWQTQDIYQNLSITYISNIEVNKKIDNRKFILPENN
jgi:outer membrane lipoprotein-sorting protein